MRTTPVTLTAQRRSPRSATLRQVGVCLYAASLVLSAALLYLAAGVGAWLAAVLAGKLTGSQLAALCALPLALCSGCCIVGHVLARVPYWPREFRARERSLERACWAFGFDRDPPCRAFGWLRWLTSLCAFAWNALIALCTGIAELAWGATIVVLFFGAFVGAVELGGRTADATGSYFAGCVASVLAGLAGLWLAQRLMLFGARYLPRCEAHLAD